VYLYFIGKPGRRYDKPMGSLRFDGVRFVVYVDDHPPPHVHARYAETAVILDLLPGGGIAISERAFAVRPPNAKQNGLNRVVRVARENEAALRDLWRSLYGGV
jgi:hypothetical protein